MSEACKAVAGPKLECPAGAPADRGCTAWQFSRRSLRRLRRPALEGVDLGLVLEQASEQLHYNAMMKPAVSNPLHIFRTSLIAS